MESEMVDDPCDPPEQAWSEPEQFRLMVENATEYAIFGVDLEGSIRTWNAGAERVFGWAADEAVGAKAEMIFPPEDRAAAGREMDRALRDGRADDTRWHVRRDGGRFWAEGKLMTFRCEHGKPRGFVKVVRDETRKKAEEDERTRLVADLERSNRDLETANEAKQNLLSLVSHELRTPVTIMLGIAQLLLDRDQTLRAVERREALEDLLVNASRLRTRIEDMLLLGRGVMLAPDQTEPLLLQRLLPEMASRLQQAVDGRELRLRTASGLPPVLANTGYVTQVVENLVGNSAKYSAADAPIEIDARREDGDVRVTVSDRGGTLSSTEIQSLFQPFYRTSAAQHAPGLGLGMAVCRVLVDAQYGRIWAENRPGGGLQVSFTLPIATPDERP
jgi:PAS domain S-box-containing protein